MTEEEEEERCSGGAEGVCVPEAEVDVLPEPEVDEVAAEPPEPPEPPVVLELLEPVAEPPMAPMVDVMTVPLYGAEPFPGSVPLLGFEGAVALLARAAHDAKSGDLALLMSTP